jgi:sodium-dependent dicarboxylate transporter 2/3/5
MAALMADERSGEGESRFDRARRRVGVWLAPTLFVLLLVVPVGPNRAAQRLTAVLALVMVLWISEALPLPATALLGPALAVALGVAGPREALAPFADPNIFTFMGSFFLAEALTVHGLDRRIALLFLSFSGMAASPWRLRWAVALGTAAVSMWMSNTAAAAMMLPIVLGLTRALVSAGSSESPRGALLAMGLAASLGGVATPVGTPPNLIVLSHLEQATGRPVGFGTFMAVGVPLCVLLLVVAQLVLRLLIPPGAGSADVSRHVREERSALGRWGPAQTACTVAFGVAVTLWVGSSVLSAVGYRQLAGRLDESIVALLAAGLLFVWPVGGRAALTWKEAARIDWGTLLLFGGGLSLGKMMFDTGLARALGEGVVRATGVDSVWTLTALAIVVAVVLTEITSNTAAANMLAPVVLLLAADLGVSPVPPALGVAFGASMGFMFPIGTPPNAIVYGSGLVPLTTMMRVGAIVDVLSVPVIFVGLRVLCPLLGLA